MTGAAAPGASRRARLRRSDCSRPGLRRIRGGRGFSYLDSHGDPLRDPEEVLRIRELAIPPAWQQVWICPDPQGHLQATGVDSAGRKQYLYHPQWREQQDRRKFDHMLEFGPQFSAKDFRTWNATVLAAVSLAADGRDAATARARKRAIDGAVRGVSEVLGNTPAVARRSYIDPRVFDRYQSGWTIGGELDRIGRLRGPDDRRRGRLEAAVIDLLHDDRASPAVAHDVAPVPAPGRRANQPGPRPR